MKNPFETAPQNSEKEKAQAPAENAVESKEKDTFSFEKLEEFASRGDLDTALEFIRSIDLDKNARDWTYFKLGKALVESNHLDEALSIVNSEDIGMPQLYKDDILLKVIGAYIENGDREGAVQVYMDVRKDFQDQISKSKAKALLDESRNAGNQAA